MHFLWASTPLTRPLKTAIWSQSWRPDSHQQWWILLKTRVYICCLQVAQIGWPEKFRWENILFLKISVLSWITTLTQMSHKKTWQTVASTSKNKPKNQILMDVMTDHPRLVFFFFLSLLLQASLTSSCFHWCSKLFDSTLLSPHSFELCTHHPPFHYCNMSHSSRMKRHLGTCWKWLSEVGEGG